MVSFSFATQAASPPTGTVARRAPWPEKMSIEPRYVGSSTIDGFAALDEQGARQPDRLLGAVRDEHLVFAGLEAGGREVPRDRPAQCRETHRQVSGPLRELAQRLLVDPRRLARENVRRRKVRAEKLDRSARALGEAPPDRVAAEGAGRVLAQEQHRGPRRGAAHAGPASLAALDPAVLPKLLVGRDDRRPRNREAGGEDALGRQPLAGADLAPADRAPNGRREPAIHRSAAVGPAAQRADEALGRHP